MAQILRGKAKEYLSHIHLCQAKARWFYSLYSNLLIVFGELVMVFKKLEGVFGQWKKFLTIWILNLKIVCVFEVGRSIKKTKS